MTVLGCVVQSGLALLVFWGEICTLGQKQLCHIMVPLFGRVVQSSFPLLVFCVDVGAFKY